MTDKLKPTKKMLELRKKHEAKKDEFNEKQNEYYQKSNAKRNALRLKVEKLRKDKELAFEATIGYGLAIKSMEEGLRDLEKQYADLEAEIQAEIPRSNFTDPFKTEFGVSEYEIDWGNAPIVDDTSPKDKK